ncbi:MAG: diguanylate cyclase, partial [Pseudomonadota bacterium]
MGTGGGVFHLHDGELHRHLQDSELSDQSVYVVQQLQDGTVVLGAELGVYQLYPRSGRLYRYGPLEGFLGQETNARAVYTDSSNMLWIGTINGVTRMDTRLPMPSLPPLQPRIIRMQTDLGQVEMAPGDRVPPDDRGVEVVFAAVSAKVPEGIEYSYRLVGLDDAWSEPDRATTVRYATLAPGDYRFEVRARYGGSPWSDATHRDVVVVPPFWQTAWFKSLSVLSALAAMLLVVRLRTNRVRRANAELKRLVEERTRHIEEANRSLELEVAERKRSELALSEAVARSRQAFESAPNGMAMAAPNGQPMRWNPAFSALLWPGGNDGPEHLVHLIAPHERERFTAFFDEAVRTDSDAARDEFCCLGASGDIIHAVWVLSVVHTESEAEPYVLIQVQDVTETRELTDQLRYQASYDELTGLGNRRSFTSALNAAVDRFAGDSQPGFLMFMDLDQFKVVNDTCGHGAGDELLRRVAQLIIGCVRKGDVVGRLGGDEFAVLLPGCAPAGAQRISETVRRAVEELSFSWGSKVFRIGVSIGAVPLNMADSAAELMQIADTACYAAKDAGRNQVHIVSGEADVTADRRGEMLWVQRLDHAMEREQLVLFGQRIKALSDWPGNPDHIEILIRLREPGSDRLIPPGAFLPAAERYGLSGKLDLWIVRTLLRQLQAFEIDPDVTPIPIHPAAHYTIGGVEVGEHGESAVPGLFVC